MEQDKLQELILKHFNKQERQIVFWYDETGENEENWIHYLFLMLKYTSSQRIIIF